MAKRTWSGARWWFFVIVPAALMVPLAARAQQQSQQQPQEQERPGCLRCWQRLELVAPEPGRQPLRSGDPPLQLRLTLQELPVTYPLLGQAWVAFGLSERSWHRALEAGAQAMPRSRMESGSFDPPATTTPTVKLPDLSNGLDIGPGSVGGPGSVAGLPSLGTGGSFRMPF